MKKLYRITTAGLGDFYIVAETSTEAENKLNLLLSKKDYGISSNRRVSNITIITDEIKDYPTIDNRLIL